MASKQLSTTRKAVRYSEDEIQIKFLDKDCQITMKITVLVLLKEIFKTMSKADILTPIGIRVEGEKKTNDAVLLSKKTVEGIVYLQAPILKAEEWEKLTNFCETIQPTLQTDEEYHALCKNSNTGEWEMLFVTAND